LYFWSYVMRRNRVALWLLAAGLIALGGWQLGSLSRNLVVTHTTVERIPLTIFAPPDGVRGPVVVIAHGFAGSQQLMYPLATTLARHGFTAVTFDFPGHGQNPTPFTASLSGARRDTAILQTTLSAVVSYAQHQFGNAPVALAGHSMGSAAVLEYASAHPEIQATVGISLISDQTTPTAPRNLLIATGALEFATIKNASLGALYNGTANPAAVAATTYGDVAAGTARRLEWTGGVEHISILFAPAMSGAATSWIAESAGRPVTISYRDIRMLWVALLYLGGLLLLWAMIGPPAGQTVSQLAWHGWRQAAIDLGPAVMTPVLLAKAPTGWVPILLGGYLALIFGLYGLAQWGIARLVGVGIQPFAAIRRLDRRSWLTILGLSLYLLILIGGVAHLTFLNFIPTSGRLPWIALFLLLMAPYFLVDAALRPLGWGRLGARAIFVGSLLFGTVLRPDSSFVLLILPLFLMFFGLLALVGGRVTRRTAQPLIAALVGALLFAWMLGIALPFTG
jgi:pimeloyl-ACP methyl ester carboxylesterase